MQRDLIWADIKFYKEIVEFGKHVSQIKHRVGNCVQTPYNEQLYAKILKIQEDLRDVQSLIRKVKLNKSVR